MKTKDLSQERVNDEALGPQTYIADTTAIQLETAVTKAAEEVERCEAAENTAAEKVEHIERMLFQTEAELQQAEEDRQKVSINRMGGLLDAGPCDHGLGSCPCHQQR